MSLSGYYPQGEPNIKAQPTAEDWAQTIAVEPSLGMPRKTTVYQAETGLVPVSPVNVAGVPAIAGAVAGLAGAGGIVGGVAGLAGAAYSIWQALGGGEGEGLFGNDLLGGGDVSGVGTGSWIDGIPLGGPGLAEPPAAWVEKEWQITAGGTKCQYYLVRLPQGGKKIAMYNARTKAWKSWRVRTSSNVAYIGKKLPSHRMLTRLRRNLGKHSADARTILRITSPASLGTSGRRRRR